MKQVLLLFLFISFSVSVFSQVANQPYDLNVCDNDNDGNVTFNLTVLDSQVLGGQDSSRYYVSYHISIYDVENDNVLDGFYTINTNNLPTTIYARVTDGNTGSFDYISFTIDLIYTNFYLGDSLDVIECDDNVSDGITPFYNSFCCGYNPSTIHRTQQDAEQGINPLTVPFYNLSPSYDKVYGREESYGCYKVTELYLEVQYCGVQDDDGVLYYNEDINGNGNLEDDDTDKDGIPDYKDDDDGDKINSADELIDQSSITGKGSRNFKTVRTFIDTDSDTIENYLDDDDDGDGVLTKDEDYNNNGTPLDDDTNNNNIPDYLEKEVALGINVFDVSSFSISPNPANNLVTLSFGKVNTNNISVNIFNIQGKQILKVSKTLQNKYMTLDISNLKSGLYFIKVSDDISETTKKLIVN